MKYEEFYDFVVKVHSIAKIGLTYSKDPYAIDNYTELNNISKEMIEKFMDVKFDKPSMFTKEVYPTPNISVRTLIGRGNQILLVREANTGYWSFPGGWAELYDSPKTAAANEVRQETGVDVEITRLIGILDRLPHKSNHSVPEYVIIFEGKIKDDDFSKHCHEISEVGFFDLSNLPEMSKKLSKEELDNIFDAYKNNKVIFD
jgi:8-oxo-dGTP diphosphatase